MVAIDKKGVFYLKKNVGKESWTTQCRKYQQDALNVQKIEYNWLKSQLGKNGKHKSWNNIEQTDKYQRYHQAEKGL